MAKSGEEGKDLNMSQDEFDDIIAKRVKRAKQAGIREVLADLGYGTIEEAKAAIDGIGKTTPKLQAKLNEAQSLAEEVSDLKQQLAQSNEKLQEANETIAEAGKAAIRSNLELKASELGVLDDALEDFITLCLAEMNEEVDAEQASAKVLESRSYMVSTKLPKDQPPEPRPKVKSNQVVPTENVGRL